MTSGRGTAVRAPLVGPSARLHQYWYPLMALVRRDVKKRYATTVLGVTWTILQPLLLVGIYTVVFGYVFRYGRPVEGARSFVFFLLSGMLPYLAISEAIHRSVASLPEDR